jgi:hypothetical protein
MTSGAIEVVAVFLALWLVGGCREPEAVEQAAPRAVAASSEAIPDSPAFGRLLGKDFTVRSARYSVDRRLGSEHADILLVADATEPGCGRDVGAAGPNVWLRHRGKGELTTGEFRIGPGDATSWEIHYEAKEGRTWHGAGDAEGLIVIRKVGPDRRIHAELSACFADRTASCLSGTFIATYCAIPIDEPVRGTLAMERPPGRPAAAVPSGVPSSEPSASPSGVSVEPRSQLIPTFPCSGCHRDRLANPQRRRLEAFHVLRNAELDHGDPSLWCYQCHSVKDIDKLVTANGSLVTIDEADRLCGSCHGDKGRDWRNGIHGLTLGGWAGPQKRKLCTNCHDPHNPWFPTIPPEPPPAPPSHGQ